MNLRHGRRCGFEGILYKADCLYPALLDTSRDHETKTVHCYTSLGTVIFHISIRCTTLPNKAHVGTIQPNDICSNGFH